MSHEAHYPDDLPARILTCWKDVPEPDWDQVEKSLRDWYENDWETLRPLIWHKNLEETSLGHVPWGMLDFFAFLPDQATPFFSGALLHGIVRDVQAGCWPFLLAVCGVAIRSRNESRGPFLTDSQKALTEEVCEVLDQSLKDATT